jgi:DNA-binding LacI/PurR family transcriptional regulator
MGRLLADEQAFANRPSSGHVLWPATAHLKNLHAQGTKLPPSSALAKAYDVAPGSVQAAMSLLVKEGLLHRARKHGTFVRQQKQLRQVGIYINGELVMDAGSPFSRCLMSQVTRRLADDGLHVESWIDQRPVEKRGEIWTDLWQAAQRREIQGLIVLAATYQARQWLRKLPISTVFLTADNSMSCMRLVDPYPQVMAALKDKGARSVGLISTLSRHDDDSPVVDRERQRFYETFFAAAREHRLETRDEWVLSPAKTSSEFDAEHFGFDAFNALWSQEQKPQAVVVYTDVAARGVVMAAVQRQVRIPHDLHLVLHRNREVRMLCPVPAMFIDTLISEVAQALAEQLEASCRGEQLRQRAIPLCLVDAETSSTSDNDPLVLAGAGRPEPAEDISIFSR